MHRAILRPAYGSEVDHVNGNGLDNRRDNLRACVRTQNNGNRRLSGLNASGYRGVSWDARNDRWRADIRAFGVARNLGRFTDAAQAARAYDAAARDMFGEFARPNFPDRCRADDSE